MGQLNSRIKSELLDLLKGFQDKALFALDPKSVSVCKGAPMQLRLIDESAPPLSAKQRRPSPE